MILQFVIGAAVATAPAPNIASEGEQAVHVSLEDRGLLRCAAALALISSAQERGDDDALKWPVLGTRAREFFVRALAQIMDNSGLDREGLARAASLEAEQILANGELDRMMPACLIMLESSGV